MRRRLLESSLLGMLLLTTIAQAAETEEFSPSLSAFLEVRPSWTTKAGTWGTEDTIALTYQVAPNIGVGYTQYFLTNIYDSAAGPDEGGLNLRGDVGFFKAEFSNLWVSNDQRTSFSFQPRLYTPTYTPLRDNGMITFNRNYFKLKHKLNDQVTLQAMEVPIIHIYDVAGTVESGANPVFENRVYAMADIKLTDKLTLSVNLLFHQKKYRDFQDGAKNNADWTFFLWTYPELLYAINDNFTVGISYYSDNLVKDDLSGFSIGDGLEKGVAQLVLAASI